MDEIIHDGQLCHYGVPGMKWGVRKADRVKSWKKRQHKRLDDYTNKDQARFDKKIAKTKTAIKNKGSDPKRAERLKTLKGKKEASKALNEIGHKHLNKLNEQDYDAVVKREIIATGVGAASIFMATSGILPIGFLHIPNTDLDLKEYRVRHSDD